MEGEGVKLEIYKYDQDYKLHYIETYYKDRTRNHKFSLDLLNIKTNEDKYKLQGEKKELFLRQRKQELENFLKNNNILSIAVIPSSDPSKTNWINEIIPNNIQLLPLKRAVKIRKSTEGNRDKESKKKSLSLDDGNYDMEAAILLVDDIYTTGSTMEGALHFLEDKGFKNIQKFAFGRTEN